MLLQLLDNIAGLTLAPAPACGYSLAGEPFGACLYNSYSTTAGSLFGAVFPFCVFTQGSNRLSNKHLMLILCLSVNMKEEEWSDQIQKTGFVCKIMVLELEILCSIGGKKILLMVPSLLHVPEHVHSGAVFT